ncbi:LPS export ABC transporter periplasmic protein LptC [Xanthobacter agilis]|uniref:Lipopolysaccharide export system protein LptC n=1 Tax=Xanthobacter agilis TaxID=47492 RepID=A0ABU0L9C7_XANAG|nr:LPS export ABC transporter periplasmic protein LptC [Xanthobacter agilis]MDQ0503670.1 lipopolysaccharide export system protein LptC [Xanthobacter agilis]
MNRHVPPRDLDAEEATAFAPPPPPDFRRAQRHSARVRWIRRLLPLAILAAIGVIGVGALMRSLQVKIDLPFDIGRLTLSGSRLTMELPKLSGFTDDNRGYSVTAKTATQDLTRPDVIDLTDIEAKLEMADHGWASVEARKGSLDTKKQFITLDDGVELAMKGGYGGHLQTAEVDVKSGTITSNQPVTFTYLDGRLVADTLTVSDRGEKAFFRGHVQLDFRLSDIDKAKAARAAEAKAAEEAKAAQARAAEEIKARQAASRAETAPTGSASTAGAGEAGNVPLITSSPRPVPHP